MQKLGQTRQPIAWNSQTAKNTKFNNNWLRIQVQSQPFACGFRAIWQHLDKIVPFGSCLSLNSRRICLLHYRAVFITHQQHRKARHTTQHVIAGRRIVKPSTNISVAIFEEHTSRVSQFRVHFHIHSRQWLTRWHLPHFHLKITDLEASNYTNTHCNICLTCPNWLATFTCKSCDRYAWDRCRPPASASTITFLLSNCSWRSLHSWMR